MKKIILSIAIILGASTACLAQSSNRFADIVPQGKSVMIIPSHNQMRIGDEIYMTNEMGKIKVTQENSKIFLNPGANISEIVKGGPQPGLNTVPGILTNVTPMGETEYMVTCVPGPRVCLFYFIKI